MALGIIGDEVLKGEVEDRNTSYFIKQFGDMGVEVFCAMILPDEIEVISEFIRFVRSRVDFLILTGGIGPTPDDVTREAVSVALGRKLILHPGAEEALKGYYGNRLNEARLKMAMLPEGSTLIDNPMSGAPGFMVENILVFPGIPALIEEMFPKVQFLFRCASVRKGIIFLDSGESAFSELMGEIMRDFPSLSVGSYPSWERGYRVRVVIRGTDGEEVKRCVEEFVRRCEEIGINVKGTEYENID